MSDDNVRDLPPTPVVIDLDTVERDDNRPPFTTRVDGKVITFADPEDLDWQDLAVMSDPHEFIHVCLSSEDRRTLLDAKLPTWKFAKLMKAFNQHYGLDDKIRDAQRQARLAGLR